MTAAAFPAPTTLPHPERRARSAIGFSVSEAGLEANSSPDLMIPLLEGNSFQSAIRELCGVMERHGDVPRLLPFYQAALHREQLGGTALHHGVAIPHACIENLAAPVLAIGRFAEPVRWSQSQASPVRLVFLVACVAHDALRHLRVLSQLARMSRDDGFRRELLAAETPAEMYQTYLRGNSIR